jgi:hypothetical protein
VVGVCDRTFAWAASLAVSLMFSLRAILLVGYCERRWYQYRTNVWRCYSGRLFGDVVSINALIPLLSLHDALCYLNGIGLSLST